MLGFAQTSAPRSHAEAHAILRACTQTACHMEEGHPQWLQSVACRACLPAWLWSQALPSSARTEFGLVSFLLLA